MANPNWMKLFPEYGIVATIPLPAFGGPPIEGLKEYEDGLICTAENCNYACRKGTAMDQHWTKCHQTISMPKGKRTRCGVVQTFFTVTGTQYFAVDQSLNNVDLEGLYSTFILDYLPNLPPLPMLPANTHREVPPLLAHTGWNLHLDTFVTDETKRKKLVTSALRPLSAKKDPIYGQLHEWVFEYMDEICNIAQYQVPYTLLRYILQYPS